MLFTHLRSLHALLSARSFLNFYKYVSTTPHPSPTSPPLPLHLFYYPSLSSTTFSLPPPPLTPSPYTLPLPLMHHPNPSHTTPLPHKLPLPFLHCPFHYTSSPLLPSSFPPFPTPSYVCILYFSYQFFRINVRFLLLSSPVNKYHKRREENIIC